MTAIVFTKERSFLSRAIRFFTRSLGESRSVVSHVGLVVAPGQMIEAQRTVVVSPIPAKVVAIYRPLGLSQAQSEAIVARAKSYLGRPYGYATVLAHALDWFLCGAYVFRPLVGVDTYPICSWVVAYAYDAAGIQLGVPPAVADPDHIFDFVRRHPLRFERIR